MKTSHKNDEKKKKKKGGGGGGCPQIGTYGVNMSIGCSGMEFEYFVTIENLVCHFRTYFSKYKI